MLIIDDSAFIRRMLQDWLKEDPAFEVVGVARDGNEGVQLAKSLRPDVITMDVEMPGRDGISALEEIMRTCPTPVLMVSSVTTKGAELTMKALELGAFDFVTKPQGANSLQFVQVRDELIGKLKLSRSVALKPKQPVHQIRSTVGTTDKVVLIASSTGGPRTLATLFEALPKGFPAPILIVQHMPAGFTASFAKRLDGIGTVPCREAVPGDVVTPGVALLAPGGSHMVVRKDGSLEFNQDSSIHGVRPAADYMMLSAAAKYGSRALGVILTGMGKDGADGAVKIRKEGGIVFGECESSCVVYGMPRAAKLAGGVDAEFKIEEMAAAIVAEFSGRRSRAS